MNPLTAVLAYSIPWCVAWFFTGEIDQQDFVDGFVCIFIFLIYVEVVWKGDID